MIDVHFEENIVPFPTSGTLARQAEQKMSQFQEKRELARKKTSENIPILLEQSGVNVGALNLTQEQRDVFFNAVTDAKAVEITGRTETEKVKDRGFDPLVFRYESWFNKANIGNPRQLLEAVSKVAPSVVLPNLPKR